MGTGITDSNMYIDSFIRVARGSIKGGGKALRTNGRASDAFVYVLSGGCDYETADVSFTARGGDIIYLANDSFYTMHVHTGEYSFIFCDFLFAGDAERVCAVYTPTDASDSENVFHRLLACYTHPASDTFCKCMSHLYEIYSVITRTALRDTSQSSISERVLEAKKYVDRNYLSSSLSVSLLAQNAGVSEVYLRKIFKSAFGISPSQYIISVKLKCAKELLNHSFITLEECAYQSGFYSLQYFCRIFKKNVGMTPTQYRNKK